MAAAAAEQIAQLPLGLAIEVSGRVYPPDIFPEDLKLSSILPHHEILSTLGSVADTLSRLPAEAIGWVFGDDRIWSRLL